MAEELIGKIKQIVEIVKLNHIKSISVQDGTFSCQIEMMGEIKQELINQEPKKQEIGSIAKEDVPDFDDSIYIKAPLVGTFYRASSPNTEPFVEIGDIVEPRQTLCIIEAMKVMNEIVSETEGRIVEIYPENGQIVDFNHVLFKISPLTEDE